MANGKVGRPKGQQYDLTSFRAGKVHLKMLDRLDRTGKGRSATLRWLIELVDAAPVVILSKDSAVVLREQQR